MVYNEVGSGGVLSEGHGVAAYAIGYVCLGNSVLQTARMQFVPPQQKRFPRQTLQRKQQRGAAAVAAVTVCRQNLRFEGDE